MDAIASAICGPPKSFEKNGTNLTKALYVPKFILSPIELVDK